MPPPAVSVVVPVYNSRDTLEPLVERLQSVLRAHASEFELILVDDASLDASWTTIELLCARHASLRGVRLASNVGQHAALLCGLDLARHPWVVTLDDDLQHPPEDLPRLFAVLDADVDLVYGSSRHPDQGRLRHFAAHVARCLLSRTMGRNAHGASALRCLRRDLRDAFRPLPAGPVCIDVLLARAGARVRTVPVRFAPRRDRASGYGWRKLLALLVALGAPRWWQRVRASGVPYRVLDVTPPDAAQHARQSSDRRGSPAGRTACT